MSFHWGWFLRYKLSQPQNHLPRRGKPSLPPSLWPQTPTRHTAYPLSPADSGGSGRLSACYGVSRASYIFSGCITHPTRPLHPAGHLLTRHPRGSLHVRAWTKLLPARLAKLELQTSFRDRLMFRRFIKTEKHARSPAAISSFSRLVSIYIYIYMCVCVYFSRERESSKRANERRNRTSRETRDNNSRERGEEKGGEGNFGSMRRKRADGPMH